ncbi:MAG: putative Fe-Mo cluster-binding NifX family protein [Halobacteriales archaeon]|jgi:predicted Fe-Mo cluster-binding NifX family protein
MKLCIPSTADGGLDATVSPHFGRAATYTVYDTEAGSTEVIDNDGKHHGGGRSPPEIIAETGADVVLCGNLGRKAVSRFEDLGIDAFCDASGTVRDAIEAWEADALASASAANACGGGHGDGDGHDHGHGHDHDHDHH